MAKKAMARHQNSIALGPRCRPKWKDENEEIAEVLVGLPQDRKTSGFGLCDLHLHKVKGQPCNPKASIRWPVGDGLQSP